MPGTPTEFHFLCVKKFIPVVFPYDFWHQNKKKGGNLVQTSIKKYNLFLRYKMFPTKNVANGGTLKYFQQKMLQKYRRPNKQKFGKSNQQKLG